MKQSYYIIGKDQVTGELKFANTYNKQEAEDTRKQWRAEYNDVLLLTSAEKEELFSSIYSVSSK